MGTIMRVLGYLKPFWYLVALCLVMAEVSAYLGALEPIITGNVIDQVISKQEYSTLSPLLFTLAFTVIGIGSIQLF
ncbi:MAG: hypothetical protein V1915_04055 [Candidatus Bathyarchaeota archaeon]